MKQDPEQREHDGDWDACPAGELARMVGRIEARQRRQRTRQMAGAVGISTAVVAVAVILAGSLTGGDPAGRPRYGGISCATCYSHFADYHAHLTGQQPLNDAQLAASMQTHLAECDMCRPKFDMTYPGALTTVQMGPQSLLIAMTPHFSIGDGAARR